MLVHPIFRCKPITPSWHLHVRPCTNGYPRRVLKNAHPTFTHTRLVWAEVVCMTYDLGNGILAIRGGEKGIEID